MIARNDTTKGAGVDARELKPLHILVAEDNPVNQKLAVALLEKAGHSADVADNGFEAVRAVTERQYDLVLMDIQMPEMDGMEATAAIRNLPDGQGQLPIIAVTANAMKGDRECYLAAGMNDYVSKPIDKEELRGALERCSSGRQTEATTQPDCDSDGEFTELFDADTIAGLEELLDTETLQTLVDSQIDDTHARLDRLLTASESGDVASLQREAHDLKSTFASFGATKASELARTLEEACRNEAFDDAFAFVSDVADATRDALTALEQRYPKKVARAS